MAAKKTQAKKQAPVKAPVKAVAKKARVASVAVKTLGLLPALDRTLRAAYLSSFTNEQCEAWGKKTKSEEVHKEAQKWIAAMYPALAKGPIGGYSSRRLTWVCELVVMLEDEHARAASDGDADFGARTSAMAVASRQRKALISRLTFVAGGDAALKKTLASRVGKVGSAQSVRDSLTGLIDLAMRWREKPLLALLADDANLTQGRLTAAWDALENLAAAEEERDEKVAAGIDSAAIDRVEGRLLRELHHAMTVFALARENGEKAPVLVAGPGIKAAFSGTEAAPAKASAAA